MSNTFRKVKVDNVEYQVEDPNATWGGTWTVETIDNIYKWHRTA